jgi:hypothetical protein
MPQSSQSVRMHVDLAVPDELVRAEPSRYPVLSVYANWSVSGRGLHEAPTTIRKQLHDASRLILQRGSTRDSFDTDVERVLAFLQEAPPDVAGIAIFACAGDDLWRAIPLALTVPTLAHVGPSRLLMPLAEATQEAAPVLVALGDTKTLRLIALDHPRPRELEHVRAPTWGGAAGSSKTGWRRGHVQHAYEVELARYARDAANAVGKVLRAEGFVRLAVAGDEVFVPALLAALPAPVRQQVGVEVHLDIRATLDDVAQAVWPTVRQRAAEARALEVAQIVERAEGGVGAVTAPPTVREMLTAGRVDSLAMDAETIEPAAAELLLRQALLHRSRVLIAREDAHLSTVGGLAATLR